MGQNVNTLEMVSMVMVVIGQRNYFSMTILETEIIIFETFPWQQLL